MQIKTIKLLHHKKNRDEQNVFIAEGTKLVNDILKEKIFSPVQIFATSDWQALNSNTKINIVPPHFLNAISLHKTPQHVFAIFEKKNITHVINPQNELILVLDNIQNPGNMGSIIRLADWFGVNAIVCLNDCVDIYNPKVIQATMGSIGRVPIVYSLDEKLWKSIPKSNVWITHLQGDNLYKQPPIKKGIIVIGNEGNGVSDELFKNPHQKILIPNFGKAESLNAAMATAIILGYSKT